MPRSLSIRNLFDKKHKTLSLPPEWAALMGTPDETGAWLVWGPEKNGKTWLALILLGLLSNYKKALYVSAEEGAGPDFVQSVKRAQLDVTNKNINFIEYETIEEIKERLKSRKGPRVVFIDNITIYVDELKNGGFRALLNEFPNVLFVFLAHEDKGEPYTATAKLCRRLAKIIIHVEGLAYQVSGRCPGGKGTINAEKAALYHGQD